MTRELDAAARYRRAIGQTIATMRAQHELSLRAMAEAAGISLAYLSELEHGQKEPSGAVLGQLAEAFGVSLPEFLYAVAERLKSDESVPEISLAGLDPDQIAELARFADWLRWRKDQC